MRFWKEIMCPFCSTTWGRLSSIGTSSIKEKIFPPKSFRRLWSTPRRLSDLSTIRFPWAEIPLMAKSHHEKLDGRGYPDGLKGEPTPGAKIICLADAFDAMTSNRPYRNRLTFEKTLREIRKNVHIQFESKIVSAFF